MSISVDEYTEIAQSENKAGEPNRDTRILNRFFGEDEFSFPEYSGELSVKIGHSSSYPQGGLDVELRASLIAHLNEHVCAAPNENKFFHQLYDRWYAKGEEAEVASYYLGVDDFWKWVADLSDKDWEQEREEFVTETLASEGWLERLDILFAEEAPSLGSEIGESDGTFNTLGENYNYDSYLDRSCEILGMTTNTESYVIIQSSGDFLVFNLQGDDIRYVSVSGGISASFPPIAYLPMHLLPELEACHATENSIYEKEIGRWELVPYMLYGATHSEEWAYWDSDSGGELQSDELLSLHITNCPIIEIEDWEEWLEEHSSSGDGDWVSGVELSVVEMYKAVEKAENGGDFEPPIIWDPNCEAYFLGGRQLHASNTKRLPEVPYWLSPPEGCSYSASPFLGQNHLGKQQLELFPELQVGNRFLTLCKGELMPCH